MGGRAGGLADATGCNPESGLYRSSIRQSSSVLIRIVPILNNNNIIRGHIQQKNAGKAGKQEESHTDNVAEEEEEEEGKEEEAEEEEAEEEEASNINEFQRIVSSPIIQFEMSMTGWNRKKRSNSIRRMNQLQSIEIQIQRCIQNCRIDTEAPDERQH